MEESQVSRAVAALQQYHAVSKDKKKPSLVEENPLISLIIALKKIPERNHRRPYFIPLVRTLHPPDDTEVCLITKTDKETAKDQLQKSGVTGIAKVIPLSKLKTKFKSFESKRELLAAYDLFLTDKRIYHLLPRHLGKRFFQKKKYPIPVDMRKKELASGFQRARDSTFLHLGLGSCCAVPIGRIEYPASDIVANITRGMETIATIVPKGWQNIQAVHLKTCDSIALPIFNSSPPAASLLPGVEAGERKRKIVHLEPLEDEEPSSRHKKARLHNNSVGDEAEEEEEEEREEAIHHLPPVRKSGSTKPGGKTGKLSVKKLKGGLIIADSVSKGEEEEEEEEEESGVKRPRVRKLKGTKLSSTRSGATVKYSAKKIKGSTVVKAKRERLMKRRKVK